MAAVQFFQKMSNEIDGAIDKQSKKEENKNKTLKEDEEKINALLVKMEEINSSVTIKVQSLKKSDLLIDYNNLRIEMETTMILQSHIIDDIYNLKNIQEKMKVILNGVVGILHHSLRFQNQYKLKNAKEIETYISKEQSYNTVNVRIKMIQNMIDKSSENSGMLKQKIGFIRDLTKNRTQELFNEKNEG